LRRFYMRVCHERVGESHGFGGLYKWWTKITNHTQTLCR
jgi:hypothetical protein